MSSSLERGIVVRVRFDPTEGREIRKTRPAVVVSNDVACRFDAVVQGVPVTTLPGRGLRPYESRCGSAASGPRQTLAGSCQPDSHAVAEPDRPDDRVASLPTRPWSRIGHCGSSWRSIEGRPEAAGRDHLDPGGSSRATGIKPVA